MAFLAAKAAASFDVVLVCKREGCGTEAAAFSACLIFRGRPPAVVAGNLPRIMFVVVVHMIICGRPRTQ